MHQAIAKLDAAARWHEDQARIIWAKQRHLAARLVAAHNEQAENIREAILELQGGLSVDEDQGALPL